MADGGIDPGLFNVSFSEHFRGVSVKGEDLKGYFAMIAKGKDGIKSPGAFLVVGPEVVFGKYPTSRKIQQAICGHLGCGN